MRYPFKRAVLPLGCLMLGCLAHSQVSAALEPQYTVNGFGTLGGVYAGTDKAQFGRALQPTGSEDYVDVGVDSNAGVQGTVQFGERFSLSGQAMLRRRYETGFRADVSLAFAKVQLLSSTAVRLGRLALPAFMVSDYRNVGYAQTWIRAPIEVYGQVPFDSVDGGDVLYTSTFGQNSVSAQAFYGKTNVDIGYAHVNLRQFWGFNASVSRGPLTFRIGRVESHTTIWGNPGLTALLSAIDAAGYPALADRLAANGKPAVFSGVGFALDWKNWIGQTEYTTTRTDRTYVGDTSGWYVMAGRRFKSFTPYAIHAERHVDNPRSDNTIPAVGPLVPLSLAVNTIMAGSQQTTTAVGLRWDVHSSIAVKLQIDRVDPEGAGLFANPKPGFSGPVTVGSAAVDFIF